MIRIVPMAEVHIPAVAEIGRECFTIPWSEEGYRAELRRGSICLTALEGETVVGFLTASVVLDEAEIGLVAVTEPARRNKTASALLEKLFSLCAERGVTVIHLEVRASNEGAVRLYERFGFIQDGLRRGYYRNPPEDALLYSLSGPDKLQPHKLHTEGKE